MHGKGCLGIYHRPSGPYVAWLVKEGKITPLLNKDHPKEDSMAISDSVIAVADSITLARSEKGVYPTWPDGVTVADVFCRKAQELCCLHSGDMDIPAMENIVRGVYSEIRKYNIKHNRKFPGDHEWNVHNDVYGATGAIVHVDRATNVAHMAVVGDCSIWLFNKNNELIYKSANDVEVAVRRLKKRRGGKKWRKASGNAKKAIENGEFRNGKNEFAYGAATGEEKAMEYTDIRLVSLRPGDRMFVVSDGFAPFMELPEFLDIFRKYKGFSTIEKKVNLFVEKMSSKNPPTYGKEKSLVVLEIP